MIRNRRKYSRVPSFTFDEQSIYEDNISDDHSIMQRKRYYNTF